MTLAAWDALAVVVLLLLSLKKEVRVVSISMAVIYGLAALLYHA